MKNNWKYLVGILALVLWSTSGGNAVEYPVRPVSVIVGYSAGGPFDTVTRVFSEMFRAKIGGNVIVEARPGANTILATRSAKMAKPDGHTLLVQSSTLSTLPLLHKDPGFSPGDFEVVAPLGQFSYFLFVNASVPAKDLKELAAYIKTSPNNLNAGVLGPGGTISVLTNRFLAQSGLNQKVAEIPYKGGADLPTALLTGDIQMTFVAYSAAAGHVRAGTIRPIAVAANERSSLLPDVPTFKELGMPDITGSFWLSLFARSDTPRDVLQKIRTAAYEVVSDPKYSDGIAPGGFEPWTPELEAMKKYIADEAQQLAEDYRRQGISPQ